jgi:flavin reductase (DIM6/NTAB) family NADH-FMN oxidoreductase RutF
MEQIDYMAIAEDAIKQIRNGAFLTVQSHDCVNVMTIGWASIGFLWGRPMFTVMVRSSRYTYGLIEQSKEFTVAVPQTGMKAALELCGTVSGKDVDKLKAANLELFPGEKVKTPVIKLRGLNFECAIVYKSAIDPAHLSDTYAHLYPEKDYHTLYYGEIRSCYSTMDE